MISRWALCSCSSWWLTTREKQCVLGRCLGATQCQQRALRLQSVCFLYLSVSSLLLFEHTITHCASLLVLFLKSQAPLLSSNRFRWLPLLWHWTASWKYAIWAFPVLWNPLIIRDIEYCKDILALDPRKSPSNTHGTLPLNHNVLLRKCNATVRLKKQEGVRPLCSVFHWSVQFLSV